MATGRVLLALLLLLSLQLGLGWGPDTRGALVTEGEFLPEQTAEAGGTWRPPLGKDLQGSPSDLPSPSCWDPALVSVFFSPGTQHAHARLRRAPGGPCQLWSLTLPVAELGLGYSSEEKITFRYCAGSCPRGARTQHGLTLARLRGQGRAHGGPCCRPTRYADVAFLDDRHRWQRLPQLSAAACGCGG